MKIHNLLFCLASGLALTACIPSVNPFYSEKDLVFESRLLGEWNPADEANRSTKWVFEAGETNAYRLTITEKDDKKGQMHARLFKLKSEYFLDLIPAEIEMAPNQVDLVAASVFPGHLVAHIEQFQPELTITFFDFDKLAKLLKDKPRSVAHHMEGDRILLTAETAALQKFIMEHLQAGDLFGEPGVMIRKK
jgi:hypothetical protein